MSKNAKAPQETTEEHVITVGCDDGFGMTKVAVFDGGQLTTQIAIPSRAVAGIQVTTDIVNDNDEDNARSAVYSTGGVEYTVGDVRGTESTRFDDFPLSDLNRVIIHDALRRAGLAGKKVRLATGLPVGMFFRGHKNNEDLIARKDASIRKVVTMLNGAATAHIEDHQVFPEGLGAWIDHAVDSNGNLIGDIDKTVAVIDVGGRTTDIAVVRGRSIDHSRCSSADIGVLQVFDELRLALLDSRKLSVRIVDSLPDYLIDQAVRTKVLHALGKDFDVADEVAASIAKVEAAIKREVNRRLSTAVDVDKVLVVGGGAYVFSGIAEEFENAETPEQAEFANARGFGKYLML